MSSASEPAASSKPNGFTTLGRAPRIRQRNLSEPGDARLGAAQAFFEERNRVRKVLEQFGPLGSRAHDTHVAHEHVPRLRQLIEPRLTQEAPDASYARVVFFGEHGARQL